MAFPVSSDLEMTWEGLLQLESLPGPTVHRLKQIRSGAQALPQQGGYEKPILYSPTEYYIHHTPARHLVNKSKFKLELW